MTKPGLPLPDYRNVERGVMWLRLMIEASEGKKTFAEVLDEMQTPLMVSKRERDPGEEG